MPSVHDPKPHRAPLVGRLEAVTSVTVLGAVGLILGLASLVVPSTRATTGHIGYKQSGTFSYSGKAAAGSVYGSAGLVTGQPIQTGAVHQVTVRFGYQFTSAKPATAISGTATFVAEVSAAPGISRSFAIAGRQRFTGSRTTLSGTLPVAAIRHYVAASHKALDNGLVTSAATVTLVPQVHTTGTVAGRRLTASYAPRLPFQLTGGTFTQAQASGSSTPVAGATAASLTPSATAEIGYPTTVSRAIDLLIAHPSVRQARELGFGLAVLCLLIGLGLARPLLRRDGEASERDRIRALYGSLLVPVEDFAGPPAPVADVAGIGALADLAKRYESMIMHRRVGDGDEYLVWDNGLIYRYRSSRLPAEPVAVAESQLGVVRAAAIDLTRPPARTATVFSAAGVRRREAAPASRLPG